MRAPSASSRLASGQTPRANATLLRSGDRVAGTLDRATQVTYQFLIVSGKYFEISFAGTSPAIRIALREPDGRLVRESPCWYEGRRRIAEISQASGSYTLTLNGCDEQQSGPFEIEVFQTDTTSDHRVRVIAERLFAEAEALVAEYTSDSRMAAIHKYEEALKNWKAAHDAIDEGITLTRLGELHGELGQTSVAMDYLNQALAVAGLQQNADVESRVLITRAILLRRMGEMGAAWTSADRAFELSQKLLDRSAQAKAVYTLGELSYFSGDYTAALNHYSHSLDLWQAVGNLNGEAQSLLALGYCHADVSDIGKAAAELNRALALFTQTNSRKGHAYALAALGDLRSRTGDKQEALNLYEQARELTANSSDLSAEGALFNSIAHAYADLGDPETALGFYKVALTKYQALGNRNGEAGALSMIGGIYYQLADLQNALQSMEASLAIFRALSRKRLEAYLLRDIGIVYAARGDTQKALELLNDALELNRLGSDKRQEAYTLSTIGYMHERVGKTADALRFYNQSLELNKATEDTFGELMNLYRIAYCRVKLGDLRDAQRNIEDAISGIEKLRAGVASDGLRTSYFSSVREHYDLYINLLMRLYSQGLRPQADVIAFEASERSRARTLLDSIGEARIGVMEGTDTGQSERENALRVLLNSKVEQYTEALSAGQNGKAVAGLREEVTRLTAEYEQLQSQIRQKNSRYESLVQPEPLRLVDVQKRLLNEDTLLLEYSLGEENSYLWAVTTNSFSSHVLPSRSVIERALRDVRDLMVARVPVPGEKPADYQGRVRSAEARYSQESARLSQILLGPVANQLGTHRLAIVAEGILQYVPFAALPTPGSGQNQTPLISNHEIVNLPSASTLAVLRNENSFRKLPDRTIAVFADPVFEASDPRVARPRPALVRARIGSQPAPTVSGNSLPQLFRSSTVGGFNVPRLPFTRQEAETILSFVPEDGRLGVFDFNASRSTAMSPELARYRIVHFATHGILNDDQPELSGLVFSLVDKDGNPQKGLLRLRDIYSLKLSAELVVLSACDTALGKDVKGEGLIGMVRGFMYSGTPRVLASLWKVDDEATAELMKEFYKHLLQEGMTPAAALRQAQITQMQKKSRQSPYYWAGFQLQGEWN